MWKEQTINWCVLLSWHHKIRNLWWDSFIAFRIEKQFCLFVMKLKDIDMAQWIAHFQFKFIRSIYSKILLLLQIVFFYSNRNKEFRDSYNFALKLLATYHYFYHYILSLWLVYHT